MEEQRIVKKMTGKNGVTQNERRKEAHDRDI